MGNRCEECDRNFGTRRGLEVHAAQVHDKRLNTFECSNCGTVFAASPGNRSGEKQFCDMTCRGEWASENRRGTDHPRWSGGTSLYYAIRSLGDKSFDAHRKQVQRENDVCQMCGADEPLEAHHVVPLLAGGLNFEVNFVGLCRSCHGKADAYIRQYVEPMFSQSSAASPR